MASNASLAPVDGVNGATVSLEEAESDAVDDDGCGGRGEFTACVFLAERHPETDRVPKENAVAQPL